MAAILSKNYGQFGYPIPTSQAWYCIIWLVSFCRADAAKLLKYWGVDQKINNDRSREVLGI